MDRLFIALQHIVPQHLLSRCVAWLANSHQPWIKNTFIRLFSNAYRIDMEEAQEPNPLAYPSFNAFFTRALRPGARPIDDAPEAIVSPVDGTISQLGSIRHGSILQAKHHNYTVAELLGDIALAGQFEGGHFATAYLAPSDYHRVHMPVAGRLLSTTYVPGALFSVNRCTTENVAGLFARNERLVTLFETEHGPMAMVLVGAMIVAGIETVWAGQIAPPPRCVTTRQFDRPHEPVNLPRGAEMGRFKLGSTVILLFAEGRVRWQAELTAGSRLQLGIRIGERGTAPDAHA